MKAKRKTKPSKLVRLPNGSWIRPELVSEITVEPKSEGTIAELTHGPRVLVIVSGHCHVLVFEAMSQARGWAEEFAALVNKEKTP